MRLRRLVIAILPMLTGAVLLAGCGGDGEGADVDCGLQECTVTFDRGVDAQASVFGLDVKLVKVDGQDVTLDVGGNSVTVPAGGQSEGIAVREVTADTVVVVVSHNVAEQLAG